MIQTYRQEVVIHQEKNFLSTRIFLKAVNGNVKTQVMLSFCDIGYFSQDMYGEISFVAHINHQLEQETELPQPAAMARIILPSWR